MNKSRVCGTPQMTRQRDERNFDIGEICSTSLASNSASRPIEEKVCECSKYFVNGRILDLTSNRKNPVSHITNLVGWSKKIEGSLN